MCRIPLVLSRKKSLAFATNCLHRGSRSTPLLLPSSSLQLQSSVNHPSRSFAAKSKRRSNNNNNGQNNNIPLKSKRGKRQKAPQQEKTPKQPKQPKGQQVLSPQGQRFIPPAMLLPTASPYAYVSMAAFQGEEDPRPIAKSLFEDIVNNEQENEPAFHGLKFDYFPPKSFQHELPKASEGGKYIPEVAFLGRSNVGKSSLINALMQTDLARCSKHPGRTQQPYYYGLLSPESLSVSDPLSTAAFVVDLPGYGFADAPTKHVEDWQDHTQQFLQDRRDAGSLQRLFLLIDARRGISRDNSSASLDLSVMRWMDEESIPYTVVVTKADCVSKPQLVKVANEACLRFQQQKQEEYDQLYVDGVDPEDVEPGGSMGPVVYVTSAKKKEGLLELRSAVEAEFYVGD